MDLDEVLFWAVGLSCAFNLVSIWRRQARSARSWLVVFATVLVVLLVGKWLQSSLVLRLGGVLWLLFVVAPGILSRVFQRRMLRENYAAARKWATAIRVLHPARGWVELPAILEALDLAQRGAMQAAEQRLAQYRNTRSSTGVLAMISYFRLTQRWEELLEWLEDMGPEVLEAVEWQAVRMRALGETGQVHRLFEVYAAFQEPLARHNHPSLQAQCRLVLFAFGGRRDWVERLLSESMPSLAESSRVYWLATADQVAGRTDIARNQLEGLLPQATAPMVRGIERRLEQLAAPASALTPMERSLLEAAASEHSQEVRFGGQGSQGPRVAMVTRILIAINVVMFGVEASLGGTTSMEALYRLGAVFPALVQEGAWWRLLAANFLHFGFLHLFFNMLALWFLGPFLERALGSKRFLLTYLGAGVGAMAIVCFAWDSSDPIQLTVGASGCVMGVIGGTAALMWRGWRRERASVARQRLRVLVSIVLGQTVLDALIPQVSMTAHLAGVGIGFAIALLLRDRLAPAAGESVQPSA
ncbi:MAG: rhomboid family intramembrane serine protease [Planctomycetes bacterium]|nr:rhomboid family intramembrane serine protease [Planctomycetota bacterium]HPF15226.1 rhomboid family intramembrane serine protease [Planctomycetota bacterium]